MNNNTAPKNGKIGKLFLPRLFRFCPFCGFSLRRSQVDGRKRLVCQKCGWVHYENPLPVAVCAARNKDNKILIAKRNFAPGKNSWALPGGFIEAKEASQDACLRELKEETGLEGKIKMLAGVYFQAVRYYGPLLIIGYEVGVSNARLSLNNELKEAKFFSKKDLPFIPFLSHRKIIEKVFEAHNKFK
jgi:NADH pyrophosphatase NudC (nudix superfamily)